MTPQTYLTAEQVKVLLQGIRPQRVLTRAGMAYVEAHDIKAHLNRIFGFARWSSEVVDQELIFEAEVKMNNNKPGFNVAYRSVVRLTVDAPDGTHLAAYTEGHVGDSTHPVRSEAHGNAVTNSESYALKRCAVMLGDQFGLSLYNKGATAPIVRRTLVGADVETEDTDEPKVEPESLEADTPAEVREVSEVKAPVVGEAQRIADALWGGPPEGSQPKVWLAGLVKETAAAGAVAARVTNPAGEDVALKTVIESTAKMIA